jgi:hypothetical protein
MPARAGIAKRDGFAQLSEDAFLRYFADGIPAARARALYAAQQPIATSLFDARTTAAAWHARPTWYAVSRLDHTTSPDLERFLAARMKATTIELAAGHLALVSHAQDIADLILAAAGHAR